MSLFSNIIIFRHNHSFFFATTLRTVCCIILYNRDNNFRVYGVNWHTKQVKKFSVNWHILRCAEFLMDFNFYWNELMELCMELQSFQFVLIEISYSSVYEFFICEEILGPVCRVCMAISQIVIHHFWWLDDYDLSHVA